MAILSAFDRGTLALGASLLLSCGSSAVTFSIVVGGEPDALRRNPPVTSLKVEIVDLQGARTGLGTIPTNQPSVDLADAPRDGTYVVEVTGADTDANRLIFGRTVRLQFGALLDSTLPIFVQRVGEWARLPGASSDGRDSPLLVRGPRSIYIAGGENSDAQQVLTGYDCAVFAGLPALGTPLTAQSIALANASVLLLSSSSATGVSLEAGTRFAVNAPGGGDFAEVVGGATLEGSTGESYIVGATRQSASSRILRIGADGAMKWISLRTPRTGASATWVDGVGLAIIGGADSGAGVELIPIGETASTELKFPADGTIGAVASANEGKHVLVIGGSVGVAPASPRDYDLGCTNSCAPIAWSGGAPPPLANPSIFRLGANRFLFVGDDGPDGTTRTFYLSDASAKPLTPKVSRHHARAVRGPNNGILLVGGGTNTLESFYD